MSTLMKFNCKVTKRIAPKEVSLCFTIRERARTVEEVVKQINQKLDNAKTFITGLESYRPDSFKQERLYTHKEVDYKHNMKEKVLGYNGSVEFNAYLDKTDVVANDLVAILNMVADKDMDVRYQINPLTEEIKDAYDETFSEAVNTCVEQTKRKISQIEILKDKELELREISSYTYNTSKESNIPYETHYNHTYLGRVNPQLDAMPKMMLSESRGRGFTEEAPYEPPKIISVELVEDLFKDYTIASCEVALVFEAR